MAHYKSNTPTREASQSWLEKLTPRERMEADLHAGAIMAGVKARVNKIQFSLDDARETVFTAAAFVQVHEYLTARGVECRGMHLAEMVRRYHRMTADKPRS